VCCSSAEGIRAGGGIGGAPPSPAANAISLRVLRAWSWLAQDVAHYEDHGCCTCRPSCPTWYPTYVQKTSVYLSAEEVARLASLAQREGTSQAEVIRRAIRTYEPQRPVDRNFSLVGSADGPGGSVAEMSEEQLLEGFGG